MEAKRTVIINDGHGGLSWIDSHTRAVGSQIHAKELIYFRGGVINDSIVHAKQLVFVERVELQENRLIRQWLVVTPSCGLAGEQTD